MYVECLRPLAAYIGWLHVGCKSLPSTLNASAAPKRTISKLALAYWREFFIDQYTSSVYNNRKLNNRGDSDADEAQADY